MSLSVVIVAQDEERTIGRVLEAVQAIADEIILVDSGSTDKTLEIAKHYQVKCHHQRWLGFAAQKNFALALACSDWLLSLDADEVVTPELACEIRDILASKDGKKFDAYKIPRILYIGDHPVRHGGFYPDAQLRLVQKGKGCFNDRLVHEAIKVSGPVKTLKNVMHHYAYSDVAAFEKAMERYARLSAKEFARQNKFGWRCSRMNELLHPLWTFWSRYILRGGILDGELGLKLTNSYSDYVRKKIRYLREEKRYSQFGS
ncbi:MAG: glycosyltransferase family 2 protein [Candidatus Obscuribacterales bacterium]|nr:glycosyltransferase family 2 protein [Candidatus Obscuribacterales bacterium]